jgi:hypothetical protein
MKYIYLILLSLVLASCSDLLEVTDSNSESKLSSEQYRNLSFNRIPPDMIGLIARFMEPKGVAKWRNVNSLTRSSLPLQKMVEQFFNISGLESIDDNAGVMALAQTSHDPLIIFTALMEDVVDRKKNYQVLFRPLMLHLIRNLNNFGIERAHVERRMAD